MFYASQLRKPGIGLIPFYLKVLSVKSKTLGLAISLMNTDALYASAFAAKQDVSAVSQLLVVLPVSPVFILQHI